MPPAPASSLAPPPPGPESIPATQAVWQSDNLAVLSRLPHASVDLVYLDPPFHSRRRYTLGKGASQRPAFDDRHPSVTAYVSFLRSRLVELRRLLRPTGSLWFHCDRHAAHHVRLLLDEVFGPARFRAEIIWRRINAKGHAFRGFPHNHDTLLWYTAGPRFTWHRPYRPLDSAYVERFYRFTEPGTGRRYRLGDLTNPNPDRPRLTYAWNGHVRVWRWTRQRMQDAHDRGLLHYTRTGLACQKRYLDEMKGRPVDSLWDDIAPVSAASAERTGYPTQKPVALLERIIAASSNPADLVLDPFCGSGTALLAAHRLARRALGIDACPEACALAVQRLAAAGADCRLCRPE